MPSRTQLAVLHNKVPSRPETCPLCRESFPTTSELKRHVHIAHTSRKEFKCCYCESRFALRFQLVSHERTHTGGNKVSCEICNKKVEKKGLKTHLLTHTMDKKYRCPHAECSVPFATLYEMRRHVNVNHVGILSGNDNSEIQCKICKKFVKRTTLKHHMKIHNEKKVVCEICHKSVTPASLPAHLKIHDVNRHLYPCEQCEVKVKTPRALRRHLLIHTGKKEFSWEICKKLFSRKDHMKSHMKTHAVTGKKFNCPVCQKLVKDVKTHMKIHEEKRVKFPCFVCGKELSTKHCLEKHKLTHTGERDFSCPKCDKQFATNACVTRHLLIHTGEKKHSCPVCQKMFARKPDVTSHMLTHSDEKKFSCSVCQRKFHREVEVRSHMVTHTKERNFSCPTCKRTFPQKSSVARHLKNDSCNFNTKSKK